MSIVVLFAQRHIPFLSFIHYLTNGNETYCGDYVTLDTDISRYVVHLKLTLLSVMYQLKLFIDQALHVRHCLGIWGTSGNETDKNCIPYGVSS